MDNESKFKTDEDIELSCNAKRALNCWRYAQDYKSSNSTYDQNRAEDEYESFKKYLNACSYKEQKAIFDLIERETNLRKMGVI